MEAEVSELKNFIAENGGNITEANLPIKRQLSYPIKKQDQAYFGTAYFTINNDGLEKLKKAFALYKKVLRFLILNKPLKKPKPVTSAPPKAPAEKTPEATAPSFDQKLENILNG